MLLFPLIAISNLIGLPSRLWSCQVGYCPSSNALLPEFVWLTSLHPKFLSSNIACLGRPSLQVYSVLVTFNLSIPQLSFFLPLFFSLTEIFSVFVSFLVSLSLEEYKLFKSRNFLGLICICILSIWYEAWSRVDTKNSFEWYIAKLIFNQIDFWKEQINKTIWGNKKIHLGVKIWNDLETKA